MPLAGRMATPPLASISSFLANFSFLQIIVDTVVQWATVPRYIVPNPLVADRGDVDLGSRISLEITAIRPGYLDRVRSPRLF